MLPKILSGEKTIESRWYKSRRAPWNKIQIGDHIYFKNSGEPVTIMATAEKILQFDNLNPKTIAAIINKYGRKPGICLESSMELKKSLSKTKYCLLVFLRGVRRVKPFNINKSGFGLMAAWITVESIEKIRTISN